METELITAVGIFIIVYGLLIWDKLNRAVVSLLGASALLLTGVINQEEAIGGIDFNTIGLLVGMMSIVAVCQKTGMFQYLAIRSVKMVKGDPWKMLVSLSVVTAVLSALLDNVTTVLLIAPVTLLITDELKIDPYPFLASQILSSNIGGAATLIGDPPNIMIGSATGLTFMDFLINVGVIMPVVMVFTFVPLKLIYGREMRVSEEQKEKILRFKESEVLKEPVLLRKCLFVLTGVIIGFVLQKPLHLESATIAIAGATVLFLISGEEVHDVMERVEWTTIFFFIGLFIVVHALVEVGFISMLANEMLKLTDGNISTIVYLILWVSALASALIDNIPFVATMIPLIFNMSDSLGGSEAIVPIWWALSIGACLGGNGSIIGASANVIVAGFAARSGHPIGFFRFMKLAFPLMLLSIVISHIYIYLRYL